MRHAVIRVWLFLFAALYALTPGALAADEATGAVEPMPGYVFFSSTMHNVAEGSTHAKLTVSQWGGSVDRAYSVGYATKDGTAVAGSDYQAVSGQLEFGNGVLSRDILIPLMGDADPEGIETFSVTLKGRHAHGSRECIVTISDDDTSNSVWHSYDVTPAWNPVYDAERTRATVTDTAGAVQARVEWYESADNGGVLKSAELTTFNGGPHRTFPDVQPFWNNGSYPHAGKSATPRGDDEDEKGAPPPAGVLDISVHPPDNDHQIVTAFVAPLQSHYTVSNLAVRRSTRGRCGQRVRLSLFDQHQSRLASIEAGADRNDGAWVVDGGVYSLGDMAAGDRIYFGVDRVDDFYGDGAEIAWTIARETRAGAPVPVAARPQPRSQEPADSTGVSMDEALPQFWGGEYSRLTMRLNQARETENIVPILRDGKAYLHGRPSFPYLDNHALIWDSDRDAVDIVLRRTRALLEHLSPSHGDDVFKPMEGALAALEAGARRLQVDSPARKDLFIEACALRRRISLVNPLLDFDEIIFVACGSGIGEATDRGAVYNAARGGHWQHMSFHSLEVRGEGPMVLSNWKSRDPKVRPVLNGRQQEELRFHGSFDLSYDGLEVLFAAQTITHERSPDGHPGSIRHDLAQGPTHIFRTALDNPGPVQLTQIGWSNGFPAWLPNGRVTYVCDYVPKTDGSGGWCRKGDRCAGFATTLWSMEADGSDAFPISWHETSETHPTVDSDGKIVYSRWDYIDRNYDSAHHLWTCYPDGRDPRAPHGNYPYPHHRVEDGAEPAFEGDGRAARPWSEMYIRPVPGRPGAYTAIAGQHHRVLPGVPIMIDTNVEDDHLMSQVKIITGSNLPHEGVGVTPYHATDEYYSPWPLSEDFYLMTTANRLLLVDRFGNEVLVYPWYDASERGYAIAPRPLRPRPVPPVIPTQTYQGERAGTAGHKKATIFVVNVYESRDEWPPGTEIKHLRILQYVPRLYEYTAWHVMKRTVLGTVPVEPDGSAYFEAPVERLIYFQALDEDGLAVQSMRSGTYVHPGEQLTCVGCHEGGSKAPELPAEPALALQRPPSPITPELSGSNPISYEKLVFEPVFQKACLECHQREGKGITDFRFDGIDEWRYDRRPSGPLTQYLWRAQARDGFYQSPDGAHRYVPGRFGARESRLGKIMLGEHRDWISEDDFRRVMLWLDANSVYSSAYTSDSEYPIMEYDPENPTGVEGDIVTHRNESSIRTKMGALGRQLEDSRPLEGSTAGAHLDMAELSRETID